MATLTIRDVPETLARKLKRRAEHNRRSLQGELLVILERAASDHRIAEPESKYSPTRSKLQNFVPGRPAPAERGPMTIDELWDRGRSLGLSTPNESTEIIRKFRDERFGR